MKIHCPIEPHLKKFLSGYLGSTQLVVSRDNDFTKDIMRYFVMAIRNENKPKSMGDFIELELSEHLMNQKRFFLTNEGAQKFNNKVKDTFMYFFFIYVNNEISTHKLGREKAILSFIEKFDLTEEEIKFDTLKRYTQRNKEGFYGKRFSSRKKILEQLQTVAQTIAPTVT